MNYAGRFLKLAATCFAVVAGLGCLSGLVAMIFMKAPGIMWAPVALPLIFCFYAAIPILAFTAFIITLQAFGKASN